MYLAFNVVKITSGIASGNLPVQRLVRNEGVATGVSCHFGKTNLAPGTVVGQSQLKKRKRHRRDCRRLFEEAIALITFANSGPGCRLPRLSWSDSYPYP